MKKFLLLGALALASLTSKAEMIDGYLDRTEWTITACSWIQDTNTSGHVGAMIDDDLNTYYHQNWQSDKASGTHWLMIDLGSEQTINGVDIWGRRNHLNGHILEGKIYASTTPFEAFADHDAAKAWYDNADKVPAGEIHYTYSVDTRDDVQSVRFDDMAARYVLIVTDQTTANHLCIGELQVQGKLVPRVDLDRSGWQITVCSWIQDTSTSGHVGAMIDDNLDTYYHQNWSSDKATDAYHWFMIDLGQQEQVDGFKYWRRQGNSNGQFLAGKVYVSNEPFTAFESHSGETNDAKTYYDNAANVAAAEFAFNYDVDPDKVRLVDFAQSAKGRYVLVIVSEAGANSQGRHLCCAEFKLFKVDSKAAKLQPIWEAGINAHLVETAASLQALGSFLGKGEAPSAVMPEDVTEDNIEAKIAEVNAALQAYVSSFNDQLIYIRCGIRRDNAYLTAIPTGNGIKLNTVAAANPDAAWQIKIFDNANGFHLYNRTTGIYLTTTNGSPATAVNQAQPFDSRINVEGYLAIAQHGGNALLNVDTSGNNLVYYSAATDQGSCWTIVATSIDEMTYADPVASTADAPIYYRLVNARWMLTPQATNMAVNGENQDGDGNGETNSRAQANVPGIYWRAESNGDGVKLINLTGYELTYEGKNLTTLTDNGSTVYLIKQTADQFHGVNAYAISNAAEQGNETCLDVSGSNCKFCWSPSRENNGNANNGSAWYFILASDEEVAAATATYVAGVKARVFVADSSLAEVFGQEFYESMSELNAYVGEQTIPALNAAKASGSYANNAETVEAVNAAVNAKVAELADRHFLMRNCNTAYSNCYMTVAEDVTAPTADASDVNALWSFIPSGEGYLMTSAATGHSLSYTDTQSAPIPVVEEGLPYSIAYNANVPGFNFTLVPTEEVANVSYYSVHQSNNNNVCKWIANDIAGSHWTLEVPATLELEVKLAPVSEGEEAYHQIILPEGVAVNTHASAAAHVLTITRIEDEPEIDPASVNLYSVSPVDGVHTISAADFNENTVDLNGLEEGNYAIAAPAGMFLVNGKPSAAINGTFAVDRTTGIKTVAAEAGVEVIFDLQGRRVNGAAKGLLIVNGKKTYRK